VSADPLIGFQPELSRLRRAIQQRQSLLVMGVRGSGKTALLRAVLQDAIYVRYTSVLHDLLIRLARELAAAGHRPLIDRTSRGRDLDHWLCAQTSVHLRGILWAAIEEQPIVLVLDDIQGAHVRNYRFLQRIYHTKGAGVIAATRDYPCLGALSRLFWDPRMVVSVPPLTQADASTLFNRLVVRLRLGHLNIAEFRKQVLDSAHGNPGEIIEMCKLAADPQYQHGAHVKFAPLRIDAIVKLGALHVPGRD